MIRAFGGVGVGDGEGVFVTVGVGVFVTVAVGVLVDVGVAQRTVTLVEDVLFAHSGVGDVAVVGIPDDKWGEQVAAFVRPADDSAPATRSCPSARWARSAPGATW